VRIVFQASAVVIVACALVGLLVYSCQPRSTELQRIPSPDRVVDAVLVAKQVNATVATPCLVYIVPAGSKSLWHPVLVGDDFVGLKLSWKASHLLLIEYSRGEIFDFTNVWKSKGVQDFRYLVEIRLQPSEDRSIPSWDQPKP